MKGSFLMGLANNLVIDDFVMGPDDVLCSKNAVIKLYIQVELSGK